MGEEINITNQQTEIQTQQQIEEPSKTEQPPVVDNSAVELEASKRLIAELQQQNADILKQLTESKVVNAKLMLQTPIQPARTAEEILYDMFSEKEK